MISMDHSRGPGKGRRRRVVIGILLGLLLYLAGESLAPPAWQPSAYACVGFLHIYQAVGSPIARALGVHCRYQPSCSHYAQDAITAYGTIPGIARALGRLWRCSPWGGGGYDPAV